jgi:anti-sigma B factor antagonist
MNHTAILLHGVDPMNILITERVTRISIVTIDGRIDAFGVPELRDRLYKQLEDGVSNFVLDLRRVTFLDSAGMAALVNLLKRARQGGGDVKLVSPTEENAKRILIMTKFDQVFQMTDTVDEALKRF